jgi:CRP-like cAMP-binding protein
MKLKENIDKITPLSQDELDFVLSHFISKRFLKHQFLVQEGSYVDYDFFIIDGLIKSSHVNEDGKEHILQFATAGQWITDPQAFHHKTKATLNVHCVETSSTLAISLENKEKLCAALPKMEYFFRKKTTEEYILLQRRTLCLISNNARDRYEDLLQNYPGIVQRVPKTMIASYLGVSRETLSRLITG